MRLDDIWSADLIFLPKQDQGFKGILTVIDCFSKYGWAIPVKSKKNKEIIEAFKTILNSSYSSSNNAAQEYLESLKNNHKDLSLY